jgi:3-oxoacyl-[acyl-carrier protein] reductase
VSAVAIVTGAARGIGLAVAERLSALGYRVLAVDRDEAVHEAARGFEGEGHVLDVTDEPAVRAFVAGALARHGRIDVLVNNAGWHPQVAREQRGFENVPIGQWEDVLRVNLTSAFVFCREVLPVMREQRSGRIVNMSSRAGRTQVPGAGAHYAAAKAGLIGMTRVLAAELAPHGVTANCIAPGVVETPLTVQGDEERRAKLGRNVPVGRAGQPGEIAHAVEYLVSPLAAYVTGTVLDVNGGGFMT